MYSVKIKLFNKNNLNEMMALKMEQPKQNMEFNIQYTA